MMPKTFVDPQCLLTWAPQSYIIAVHLKLSSSHWYSLATARRGLWSQSIYFVKSAVLDAILHSIALSPYLTDPA